MMLVRTFAITLLVIALSACARSYEPPDAIEPNPARVSATSLASDLSQALQFQTLSNAADPEASWEAFEAFRVWIAGRYPLTHAAMTPEDLGYGTLWFTLPGANPELDPIVFIAHQDVVPVEAGTLDDWTHPPFDGVIADGFVWGRGALDMKGHLITFMTAMETLLAEDFTPARTIHIGLGHDEEVGGAGARSMVAWLEARNRRAWFVLDEGGSLIETLPLTGKPAAMVGVAEKGFLTIRVNAQARGGHSSTPPQSTAVGLLARAIIRIEDAPFDRGLDAGPVDEMLVALSSDMEGVAGFMAARPGLFAPLLTSAMSDDDATRAMLGTTIAPTVIDGGSVANVLPQEASVLINLRLHPRDSGDEALAHLRRAVAGLDGVSVEALDNWSEAPPVAETDGPAWAIIAGAARSHAPEGASVAPTLMMATTDIRAFAGVADNLYRYNANPMDMSDLERIHGTDERIRVDALPPMVSYFRTVIAEAGMYEDET